jgi:hypothetical protein
MRDDVNGADDILNGPREPGADYNDLFNLGAMALQHGAVRDLRVCRCSHRRTQQQREHHSMSQH